MTPRKPVSEARADWEKGLLAKTLAKAPESEPQFETDSGMPVDRLYGPSDSEAGDYVEEIGYPGQYPMTRGVQPTMYRGRHWTMRQYAGFGTAEESNERYKYLLGQGQSGLSVAFDLPTQIGYDSDDRMARGEVGKVGVAIDTLADMETLFAGIPLSSVSTSMTINAPAAVLLAMYQVVGEKQGVSPDQLRGTIQNDILKEYIARGTYIYPPAPSIRLITDIFRHAAVHLPQFNTISISGYHIREAGSTAAQEVGFTLADAICYIEAAISAGLPIKDFAQRLSFFFNASNDLFEEVAKFRAARRLYARIMTERFGVTDDRCRALRFHCQTAGNLLTAQQVDNNVVRVAIQALAAALGGAQSLHTNSKDEALGLPSEAAALLALRTQQVIAEESGVCKTVDPMGGSWYLEDLTDRIEAAARAYIDRIDAMGGMVKAIENGFPQREIEDAAYRLSTRSDAGKRVVVGVNRYQQEEPAPPVFKVDPTLEMSQVEKLRAVRASRDSAAVSRALQQLEAAARGTDNLMPPIIESVRAYASVGEICGVLRGVFGEYGR